MFDLVIYLQNAPLLDGEFFFLLTYVISLRLDQKDESIPFWKKHTQLVLNEFNALNNLAKAKNIEANTNFSYSVRQPL